MRDRNLNRMSSFDYSNKGGYFLTICSHNKINFFGEIIDDQMILNESGKIAKNCWEQISNHFKTCVMDEFVVMPNHVHGIIFLEGDRKLFNEQEFVSNNVLVNNEILNRHHQRIPVILGSYKSAVSKSVRLKENKEFKWQKSYYDRIIRDNDELIKIRDYIIDNPKNWAKDSQELNENFSFE